MVPFHSIVNTNTPYTSSTLRTDLTNLQNKYPFLQVSSIGNSVLGQPIHSVRIGTGSKEVFYNASIHAQEWITTPLLMKFLDNYAFCYTQNIPIYSVNTHSLYDTTSLYIVPMVNPDGVDLVTGRFPSDSKPYLSASSIAQSYPNISFPDGWKANIRGIDLNLQFPAGWEQAKRIKYAQGFTRPAPRDFVGYRSSYRTRSN